MEAADPQLIYLIPVLSATIIGVCIHFYYAGKIKVLIGDKKHAQSLSDLLRVELEQERSFLSEAKSKIEHYIGKSSAQEAELKHLNIKYQNLLDDNDQHIQKFENIAHRILKSQSVTLNEYQTKGMHDILNPLKERIKVFEEKIEKSNLASVQRHQSLKEQIKYLSSKSDQVANDANNLAKALKGNYKQQGNWGELILESILDKSGLQKDREYFVQVAERNDNGKLLKPDVVIELPENKKLIIDSKVSLSAFSQIVNAESNEEAEIHKRNHLIAVRNHIDTLARKNYHNLYQIGSPDFVMMFIPIDTAFIAALDMDSNLYNYAFDKNIVIVTSSTLLATLKTVETMWRNEKQNKHAIEISVEAGKMYDKFVNFLEDMKKLGTQMQTAQNTYQESMKKLSFGNGNLIKRAEKVRSLGAKNNKKI
ncbi:MAG: DNA recombination protein RmuC [Saprospiraceae bacterium]|nr:DNA recombination protein RmuC [Bacteroidia bacterium]NNE14676.1 DNA recombination protein RmuC [Saprospiraceae bacterium]NNL93909.1 DNA recombination protein RmuC [Saprospiraceae bacterium]